MIFGVDPKVDYAFKHLFGRKRTRPILIDVLHSVLTPGPGHQILTLDLLNPFNPKEALDDKLSILDIKARDQAGRQFNVEMQMLASRSYEKRILYYWSRFYQQQLHEGQQYAALMPTISISFLNHVLFPEVPDYHLRFRLLEETRQFPMTNDLEFHILELPKFTKTAAELETGLDIWLYFLRHAEKIDTEAVPATLKQPLVLRALEELKMVTQTELERHRYEDRLKWQLDQASYAADRERARLEALEAVEKGRQEGFERGRTEEKISMIHWCDRLLKRPETPVEELARMSLADLTRLAEELQAQVLKQR